MQPREHVLSQQVLEFLIEHQKHFVDGVKTVCSLYNISFKADIQPLSDFS